MGNNEGLPISQVGEERLHFDRVATERREHGFVPDLERMEDCDFFYLSPFRRKALANLALRPTSDFFIRNLVANLPKGAKVLDLACGSGWFSLELARAGFNVMAVDLSESNIKLARETLQSAKLAESAGGVTYDVADLNNWQPDGSDFSAVCYVGALHHLMHPESLLQRIRSSLKPGHFMVAAEPLPENYGEVEAAIALLIRTILSSTGSWYENIPLPDSEDDLAELLREVGMEYANWADKSELRQSPMNNATNGQANLELLSKHYEILEKEACLALNQRIIGGLRLDSDAENLALARFIIQIERTLLANGVIKPGTYNVFGKSK